jgi:molybdate transport system permease protein
VSAGARSPGRGLAAVACLGVLLLALPVGSLLVRAAGGDLVARLLTDRAVLDALRLSLLTTAASLALTLVVGGPIALFLARRRSRGISVLETIVDLPIVLPPSVAGLALLLLLGRQGALGSPLAQAGVQLPFTTLAVILAQTFVSAPFFIRAARAGIAAVQQDLEDAARVDGASELAVLRRVTVPLAGPALAAGLVMTWARALGEFGATIMFAGNVPGITQTLPLVVYAESQAGDLEASVAAAVLLLTAAFAILLGVRLIHWGRALDLRGG